MDVFRRRKKWRARLRKQFAVKKKVLKQQLATLQPELNRRIANAERRLGRKQEQS
jgi:hypothetical protein